MTFRLQDSVIGKALQEAQATGQRIELPDHETRGLRLRLTPRGWASWSLMCKDATGRTRRYLIGGYPGIGLSAARIKARKLREQVRDGFDPIAERRETRRETEVAKRQDGLTLAVLFERYETLGRGGELKSWPGAKPRLSAVFKLLLDRPVGKISLADLQEVIDSYCLVAPISAAWVSSDT